MSHQVCGRKPIRRTEPLKRRGRLRQKQEFLQAHGLSHYVATLHTCTSPESGWHYTRARTSVQIQLYAVPQAAMWGNTGEQLPFL